MEACCYAKAPSDCSVSVRCWLYRRPSGNRNRGTSRQVDWQRSPSAAHHSSCGRCSIVLAPTSLTYMGPMKRRNHLTLLIGLLVTILLGACAEQTYPTPNLDGEQLDDVVETTPPTTVLDAAFSVPETEPAASFGFPHICQTWEGIQNRPDLTELQRLASHDLVISTPHVLDLNWERTDDQPYDGLSTTLVPTWNGNPSAKKDSLRQLNPNFTFVATVYYREGNFVGDENTLPTLWDFGYFPPNSALWVRDEAGEPVPAFGMDDNLDGTIQPEEIQLALVDFAHPDLIELIAQKALALEQSGVVDGIFLDWWNERQRTVGNYLDWSTFYMTLDEEVEARLAILRRIREVVSDDFLIIGNTNNGTAPQSAPYMNGMFMEAVKADTFSGYTTQELQTIEDSLYWGSENLREPRTSCLEGWRVVYNYGEPDHDAQIAERNSEENQRWMRLITTLSLTHSDGNVIFGADPIEAHAHNWYDFWDADLGLPVSDKRQLLNDVAGLFIREFTNGYAIYNRSGEPHTIVLPHQAMATSTGAEAKVHQLNDLDGDIYLGPTSGISAVHVTE